MLYDPTERRIKSFVTRAGRLEVCFRRVHPQQIPRPQQAVVARLHFVLEFLDTDIFHLSREHCVAFLDPMIESWDIDLATFALGYLFTRRIVRVGDAACQCPKR